MRTLLGSNFYSVLYNNYVIWLKPEISTAMKQNLLSISANALRSTSMFSNFEILFNNIHKNNILYFNYSIFTHGTIIQ